MLLSAVVSVWIFLVAIVGIAGAADAPSTDYVQVPGLMAVRTTFSDGAYEMTDLAKMAREKGFGVLVINDHDCMAMEYGVPPLRNLTKKKVDLNSINKYGATRYLASIEDAARNNPGIIIVPGSLSAPFYYWTGRVFGDDVTAHNHERRILTVGLQNPGDYENLPILHNGSSAKYLSMAKLEIFISVVAFAAATVLIVWGGFYRVIGAVIAVLSLVFLINSNPFRTSPFDPYHGDQGIAPYQLLIDDVSAKGGLTFWDDLETKSGVRRVGPINIRKEPHPQVLQESAGYTGFAALCGDSITITEPGNLWDTILVEYCKGYRNRPTWGIAVSNDNKEGGAGEQLGNFQTVFLLKDKTAKGVMEALRTGKMYAYRGSYPQSVRLNEFSVSSPGSETKALSGDEIVLKENPRIRIALASAQAAAVPVKVRLIRSGEVVKIKEGPLPMEINYEDPFFRPGERIFYRMDMEGLGTLVSNPIFVTYEIEETGPAKEEGETEVK
jgi:hypothetical protein